MKFPLPADYFKCPPLSPDEGDHFARQSMQDVREMIEKADKTNPRYEWKLAAEEAEIQINRGRDPYTPPSTTLHSAIVDVAGTIEEVAYFYRNETTDDSKDMVERTGHGLTDVINLYTIKDTPEFKARLQWLLVKTTFDGVVRKRDFCYLEEPNSTVLLDPDENGRRTWIRCLKSVQMPCCPEFPDVIRAVQYGSGLVCRETSRPGYVKMIYLTHGDLRGSIPNLITDMAVMGLCRSVKGIDRKLREDRLSASPFLTSDQFVSLSSRQRCHLCQRSFGPFRKKRNCFKYGEVVCAQCGPKWNVKVAGAPAKVTACNACSVISRWTVGRDIGSVASVSTTPTSASSTDVWRVRDDESDDSTVPSLIPDGSTTTSHLSNSTIGRPTFDHSQD
ncbi:unnamed protein product [Aphanomyces euteiches]